MPKRLTAVVDPYVPMYVEESVLPDHNDWLPELGPVLTVPIARGERMYHRTDFKSELTSGALDITRPDFSHATRITEVQQIAVMADTNDVAMAPHCPLGPVALATCLRVDTVVSNDLIKLTSIDIHYNDGAGVRNYVDAPAFTVENGILAIPDGPELRVDSDESAVRKRADNPDLCIPIWHHDDGSVADWKSRAHH